MGLVKRLGWESILVPVGGGRPKPRGWGGDRD